MKKLIIAIAIVSSWNSFAQTLFVPQGTNGIGTSSSNIGIGTSNPNELLHINGNVRGSDEFNGALKLNTASGFLIFGCQSSSSCDFLTDRNAFVFNKPVFTSELKSQTSLSFKSSDSIDFRVSEQSVLKVKNNALNIYKELNVNNQSINLISGTFEINPGANLANFKLIGVSSYGHIYSDYRKNLYFRSMTAGPSYATLLLEDGGNVGIGFNTSYNPNVASVPQGFKLAVNGGILCEEIKVIADVPAADYVFEDAYPLLNLTQVEDFIRQNKHLPDIPSAQDFKVNGYKVGEMDNLLLQKIEELTLYVIEQNKKLNEQENIILSLQKKIDK